MGCGKSSVGRRLSTLLSCSYTDLDAVIEETDGRSIPEIFAADGEGAFRTLEAECLQRFISSQQDRELEQSLPSQAMAARCKSPLDYLLIAHDLGKGTYLRHKVAQSLINELSEFRADDKLLMVALFNATDNLRVYAEAL